MNSFLVIGFFIIGIIVFTLIMILISGLSNRKQNNNNLPIRRFPWWFVAPFLLSIVVIGGSVYVIKEYGGIEKFFSILWSINDYSGVHALSIIVNQFINKIITIPMNWMVTPIFFDVLFFILILIILSSALYINNIKGNLFKRIVSFILLICIIGTATYNSINYKTTQFVYNSTSTNNFSGNGNQNNYKSEIISSEEATVGNTTDYQKIQFENVSVNIPSYFVEENMTLSVNTLKYDNKKEKQDIFTKGFDISLKDNNNNEIHELNGYIEVEIPFEDRQYSDSLSCLDVMNTQYYDKEQNLWLNAASYYDVDKGSVVLLTHHLTEFRMIPSSKEQSDKLLKELPTPQLMYSEKYGLYARGTSIEELEANKSEEREAAIQFLMNATSGNTNKAVKGLDAAVHPRKIVDIYKQYMDVPEQLSKLYEAPGKLKNIENLVGELVDLVGQDKANELFSEKGPLAKLKPFLNDKYKIRSLNSITESMKDSGCLKKLATVNNYLSKIGNVNFVIVVFDEMTKGNYSKGSYEIAKKAIEELAPKLHPVGFLVSSWFFIAEKGYEEYKWYELEGVKDVYNQYYTGPSTSRPASYWHNRYKKIVDEKIEFGEDPTDAIRLLDKEMNEYLDEFWSDKNIEYRKQKGVGEVSDKEKQEMKNVTMSQVMHPLQKNILLRYIEQVKKSNMEYAIFTQRLHYEDNINRIAELEIKADNYYYNMNDSVVNVLVDNNVIWSGKFNSNGVLNFKARFYKLLPENTNSESTILVKTLLVDEEGNEYTKIENVYIKDLWPSKTFEYTERISRGVKIIDKDRNISINLDESYKFEYEYNKPSGLTQYQMPDSVKWSVIQEGASIEEDVTFLANLEGVYTVVITAYYNDGTQFDDSTDITVVKIDNNLPQDSNNNTDSTNSTDNTNQNSQNNKPTPHTDYDVEHTDEKAKIGEELKIPEPTKEEAKKTSDWMKSDITKTSDGGKIVESYNKDGYTNTIIRYDANENIVEAKEFSGYNRGVVGGKPHVLLYYKTYENGIIKDEIKYYQSSGEVEKRTLFDSGKKKMEYTYIDVYGDKNASIATYLTDTSNGKPMLDTLVKYSEDKKFIIYDENISEGYKKEYALNRSGEWVLQTSIKYVDYYNDSFTRKVYNIETGYLDTLESFVDGKMDGKYDKNMSYIKDNVIVVTTLRLGQYQNGNMVGIWYDFYNDGVMRKKETYNDGKLDGDSIEYYGDGVTKREVHYNNGLINGELIEYYEDGSLKVVWTYINGVLNGMFKQYYSSNEKIKLEGMYSNGKKVGEWRTYDQSGNVQNTTKY